MAFHFAGIMFNILVIHVFKRELPSNVTLKVESHLERARATWDDFGKHLINLKL